MGHDELADMAAGYALSALDTEEQRVFEAHLTTCEECHGRVKVMQSLAEAMPLLVEERVPSVALKERILAATRSLPRSNWESARSAPGLLQVLRRPMTVAAAMVMLLLAVVSLAVWDFRSDDDLAVAQQRLDTSYQGIRIMAKAERWWRFGGTDVAPDAAGSLAFSEQDGAACLVVWGLSADDGETYQAWVTQQDVTEMVGRLWRIDSALWIILDGNPSRFDKLEIILVKPGDQAGPQRPTVVSVPLAGT